MKLNGQSKDAKGFESASGVLPLSSEDLLEVSYIENKTFKGTSYKNHIAGLEMELMGAEYQEALNGLKGKNLSFGYFEKGRLAGYVIAYVGYDKERKSPVVYISDFAVLHKQGKAAGSVLNRLFESIQETAGSFEQKYQQEIKVLLQATTTETGNFRLFMPLEGDKPQILQKKRERLAKYGLHIVEQKELKDGTDRVEFVLSVATKSLETPAAFFPSLPSKTLTGEPPFYQSA